MSLKSVKLVSCLVFVSSSFSLWAGDRDVVYGEDNRVNLAESKNELFKTVARSTAGMIPNDSIELKFEGILALLKAKTLQESMNLCPGESFADEVTAANCSGFLVGRDLLVTAGHCMRSESDCQNNKWVFDYRQDILSKGKEVYVSVANMYGCKKIVQQVLDSKTKNDFALIQLDREVEDREPLTFRIDDKIADDASLVVIGHPSGLPTKIADGAKVRKNDNNFFFVANLDTFGGNSGSAVFNAHTGLVEGILVRGENDYESDSVDEKNCMRVKRCAMDECRGEDVQKIPPILRYLRTGDY